MVKGFSSIEAMFSMLILVSSLTFTYALIPKFYPLNRLWASSDYHLRFTSLLISLDRIGFLDEVFESRNYMKLYSVLTSFFTNDLGMIIIDGFNGSVLFDYHFQNSHFQVKLCYYFYSQDNRLLIIVLGWNFEG